MNMNNMNVNNTIIDKIKAFKINGISVLDKYTEKDLTDIIHETNNTYYNTNTTLLTDNEYDIIKEYIQRKYPKNQAVAEIGAPVIAVVGKSKVTLPYEMASMDKIKPDTNAITSWKSKYSGSYVLSLKLDGVSGLYITKNGKTNLYTRGNGIVGQDITHILSVLKLPVVEGWAVRGEFILPKTVFETKYKNDFANARNLVSGIINSKTADNKTNDLHFVAYEIIDPPLIPSAQMRELKKAGFEVVYNETTPTITNEMLSEKLISWRTDKEYEIDGIIVTDDKIYPRSTGNPDHAFAFKMVLTDQVAEAKVVDVIWSPSKNGLLKPRVRIEPIKLGGVTIEYATGFNGKFIEDNRIGIGAFIQIIRSGDVIPFIKSVSVPAETAKMPVVPYIWGESHVDVMLENVGEDATVREKNIAGFFITLEVDGLSIGNVKRIFNSGYDTIPKILKMSRDDFEKIDGFQKKTADKLYSGIVEKVASATLVDIIVASNKMGKGMGKRKLEPVFEKFPNILTCNDADDVKIGQLKTVAGIGQENSTEFVKNIPVVLAFLRECGLQNKLNRAISTNSMKATIPQTNYDVTHPLYGKKVVMTKIRDKEIIDALPKFNATLVDTMKINVFALIVKSKDDKSTKTEYALQRGIPIMTADEFRQTYL
jgi:NAD-dependent DNA ligase